MLKRKPQPSEADPDVAAEDEHAYEGGWYRSLKAKAARRAEESAGGSGSEQDEPESPSEEETVAG